MKAKKRRLPALSRRGKVIRNLLGFAAVLLGAWVLFGCPAWTENGALRQLERTLLLEPGTVRCRHRYRWDSPTVLVTGENYAYVATVYEDNIFWREAGLSRMKYAVLDQGPVLFPWVFGDFRESMEEGTWLCPNPPEGAQRAELAVTVDYEIEGGLITYGLRQERDYEQGSVTLYAQGTLEDSGLMRIKIAAESGREAVVLRALLMGDGYEETEDGRLTSGTLDIYVTGNGFLYNMVRIIAGTLVYAGLGKLGVEDVKRVLETGDRTLAGKTLPPEGLTLVSVGYGDGQC